MNIIEKLESFQQKLVGFELYGFATELQNIIEEYKNAQEPVGYTSQQWIDTVSDYSSGIYWKTGGGYLVEDYAIPLFTHPPLSDETVKVPEGYAIVPIDPSESMLNAALNGTPYKDDNKELMLAAYKAMIDEAMKADNAEAQG